MQQQAAEVEADASADDDQHTACLDTTRIQVVVRVRPVLPHEASQQIAVTCGSDGGTVQIQLPEREFTKPAIAACSKPDAKSWEFDACLTGSTTQAELFDVCAIRELVEAAVDGYNVTVFAFGQTGSGKTHTICGPIMAGMQGVMTADDDAATSSSTPASPHTATAAATPEPPGSERPQGQQEEHFPGAPGAEGGGSSGNDSSSRCSSGIASDAAPPSPSPQQQQSRQPQLSEHEGLLARCVHQLYASVAARRDSVQCAVTISCTEVYNETITDLLARNKNQQLQVRKDPRTNSFYADGLTLAPAQVPGRALRLLSDALAFRHTRAHKLNSYSSRSHCLITLTVTSQDVSSPGQQLMGGTAAGGGGGGMRRCGKLVLVDLAGSERLNSTGSSGASQLKETGAINKSLFTLGQVLAALSVRGGIGGNNHVPYRDSRLTQLLWEGLRGGGRVLMLACLCPLKAAAEESLNTLHFASIALRIKSTPVIMLDPQDAALNEMRSMIKLLQEDCKSLASALTQICNTGVDVTSVLQTLPPNLVQDALRYGSSSAPALDQQLRQRSPSKGHGRGSRSGSLGRPKVIYASKPGTADPSMRHSMPAVYRQAGNTSPSSKQRRSQQQQQQQQRSPWGNGAASDRLLPSLLGSGKSPSPSWGGAAAAAASSSRDAWKVYGSPPRSSNSMRGAPGKGGVRGLGGGSSSNAGTCSFGPSTGAKLYPGSLRQEMYHAGASAAYGVLSNPQQHYQQQGSSAGVVSRSWDFTARLEAPAPRTSQLVDPASVLGGSARGRGGGAGTAAGGVGAGYHQSGISQQQGGGAGGIWGLSVQGRRSAAGPEAPSLDSFPELAALEQQFQQLQQQPPPLHAHMYSQQLQLQQHDGEGVAADQQQLGVRASSASPKPFDVQLLGNSGVLLPSGLRASISEPRSLVPVRMGVADGECVGASPDTSPVAVALAAADSHMRPIAVALPAELTAAAAAAAGAGGGGGEGDGEDVASSEGGQPDPQALTWAERNLWFGSDEEMTRLAYEVHDMLVGEQGVDPSSQLYYTAIESHVAAAMPQKWAHWQQLTGAGANKARGSPGGHSSPAARQSTAYISYKLPLKDPVPRFTAAGGSPGSSPPWQQQQQGRGMVGHGPSAAAPTLSQLLQHPVLGSGGAMSPRGQYGTHQQQAQQAQHHYQQLDRSLPQQLLQQYQQEHPLLVSMQQQQQQHSHSSLPELRPSVSPQPPTGQGCGGDDDHPQQGSPSGSLVAASGGYYSGGLPGVASKLGPNSSNNSSGSGIGLSQQQQQQGSSPTRSWYCNQQQLQQQLLLQQQQAGGLAGSGRTSPPGGISAAASRVLQASSPSFYDGCGPLTSGTRPAWASNHTTQGVQAGADLSQVLRSGLNPGNKSLAEMQADYKAARALVLDRLRRQKEAAEVQRKQILLQLGRAISNSAWRA